jgi:hypothetical protein
MQEQATLVHFTKHTTPKEVDISTSTSKERLRVGLSQAYWVYFLLLLLEFDG